jgi:hypothetical protein
MKTRLGRYILDGHEPVACEDLLTWGRWMEAADRHVALTLQGDVEVSTVFLGLDHGYDDARPLLFESMLFVAGESCDRRRYSTWEEAEAGHAGLVKRVWQPQKVMNDGRDS